MATQLEQELAHALRSLSAKIQANEDQYRYGLQEYLQPLVRFDASPVQHQVAVGVRHDAGGSYFVGSKEAEKIFADAFGAALLDANCKDFLCFDAYNALAATRLTVTIQKAQGVTPARAYQEVAEERDQLETRLKVTLGGYDAVKNSLQANHLALLELVKLKRMKESSEAIPAEYTARKALAWTVAMEMVDHYAGASLNPVTV